MNKSLTILFLAAAALISSCVPLPGQTAGNYYFDRYTGDIFAEDPVAPAAKSILGFDGSPLRITKYTLGADFDIVSGVLTFTGTTGSSLPSMTGNSGKYLTNNGTVASWVTPTLAWGSLTGVPSTFAPSAHASSHAAAGSDPLTLSIAQTSGLQTALDGKALAADLSTHTGNTSNPHAVTKSQVGLGNADNTSDANKPISTATQTALDGKQATGNYLTSLTGDATASGPGSAALTLANTAVTPGSYFAASITVDAKGRVTAASNSDLSGKMDKAFYDPQSLGYISGALGAGSWTGGSLKMDGGTGTAAYGGSVWTQGGNLASARAGNIHTYGGEFRGGDIITANGGGDIDTASGYIRLGLSGARFSLQSGASPSDWQLTTPPVPGAVGEVMRVGALSGSTSTMEWYTPVTQDVRVFTVGGGNTWFKPAGAKSVHILMIGGGGGGGSGRKGVSGGVTCGGGGGAGGCTVEFWTNPDGLGATETVTVGAGGVGGASQTANSTNGNAGTAGGDSTFDHYTALGGANGAGGTTASGTGGATKTNGCIIAANASNSSIGGAANAAGGTGAAGTLINYAVPSGGGAGGGLNASNTATPGGAGGSILPAIMGSISGGAGGAAATSGSAGSARVGWNGTSGGGGGSSASGNAGAGGAGQTYGAGGGGGGASRDSTGNSGAGGAGANGIVVITTTF